MTGKHGLLLNCCRLCGLLSQTVPSNHSGQLCKVGTKPELRHHGEGLFASSHAAGHVDSRMHITACSFVCALLVVFQWIPSFHNLLVTYKKNWHHLFFELPKSHLLNAMSPLVIRFLTDSRVFKKKYDRVLTFQSECVGLIRCLRVHAATRLALSLLNYNLARGWDGTELTKAGNELLTIRFVYCI